MNTFGNDIKYGLRMLIKSPVFTLVATITLALGIGANTAIFSVVNAVLLRALPYHEPERLVCIWENNPTNETFAEVTSVPNFIDWRSQNQSFESITATARTALNLTGDGEPERLLATVAVENFFEVLGVTPKLGRAFAPEEYVDGSHRVVILSHGVWLRRFGGNPGIIDQKITLNGNPYTVVGVMHEAFQNPRFTDEQPPQAWVPFPLDPNRGRRSDFLSVIARLKPGVTVEQANAEMIAISNRLGEQYPNANAGFTAEVTSLHERFVGDVRPALLVLLGAVGLLLLIACANVANLLLARATARQKEFAIRAALGAKRWRLVRQLLTESAVMALLGGAAGLLLGSWGLETLLALAPQNVPRLDSVTLDARVLMFTLGVSLLTGFIFGVAPAIQSGGTNLHDALKEGGRGSSDAVRGNRIRGVLTALEMGLALVLLIGAGLMMRSFIRLQNVDPGFNGDRVTTMQLLLPTARYAEAPQIQAFVQQLLERVKAAPGVESAGTVDLLPLGGSENYLSFVIEGRPPQPPGVADDAEVRRAGGDFFKAMGIPVVRGRVFDERDGAQQPRVCVINETAARRFWSNENPLGQRITFGNPDTAPWLEIIGIVGDVRGVELATPAYPQVWGAAAQNPSRLITLAIKTSGNPEAVGASISGIVRGMDSDLPVYNTRSMLDVLSNSAARSRFNTLLIGVFAAVALMLAAVGIYGVMSYSVSQRSHEIGVRMALGAQRGDIVRMVLGSGLRLSLAGVGAGLFGAFALTRLMESLLFGTSPTDPGTFAAITALLVGVALLACYIPARRATRVDPMVALRYE